MEKKVTPIKAIRAKCLDCKRKKEGVKPVAAVRSCDAEICPLHPFRLGHRPKEG